MKRSSAHCDLMLVLVCAGVGDAAVDGDDGDDISEGCDGGGLGHVRYPAAVVCFQCNS